MAKVDSFWRQWAPRLLSILRIITAFLFMQHGAQKLFGLLGGSRGGSPPFLSLSWIAWSTGILRRPAPSYRIIYTSGGVHSLRNDGGGLFSGPCGEGILADTEWWGTGRSLLFRFSLSIRRGRWPVEHGFNLAAREILTWPVYFTTEKSNGNG